MESADYKYVSDTLSQIRIGSRYTYAELVDNADLSHKYRSMIRRFFLEEVSADTTLESHLYYLKPGTVSYAVYTAVGAKAGIYLPQEKILRDGSIEIVWKEETVKLRDLADLSPEEKKKAGIFIHELILSKAGLTAFAM